MNTILPGHVKKSNAVSKNPGFEISNILKFLKIGQMFFNFILDLDLSFK